MGISSYHSLDNYAVDHNWHMTKKPRRQRRPGKATSRHTLSHGRARGNQKPLCPTLR